MTKQQAWNARERDMKRGDGMFYNRGRYDWAYCATINKIIVVGHGNSPEAAIADAYGETIDDD